MASFLNGAVAPVGVLRAFDRKNFLRGALMGSAAFVAMYLEAPAQAAPPYEYSTTAIYSAPVSLNSLTPTQFLVANGVTATLSGAITEGSANQSVEFGTISGAGTMVLSNGTNQWTGTTTIDAGATVALAGANLATSRTVVNGVLDVSGAGTVAGVDSVNAVDYNYGNYTGSTAAGATGNAGTLNWNSAGYFTTGTIAFTNSSGIITDIISTNGTDAYTFYNVLSGNPLIGTLCVSSSTVACFASTGNSQDVSSAISTFNGGTGIFLGGTISATVTDQFGQGASVLSLGGSGSVVLGTNTLTIMNASDSFGGVISGAGGVTVAAGTETLTGSNSYTGATTIASGATLALAGTGSIATSSTVNAEGTLDISQETGNASIASLSGAGAIMLGANTLILTNAADTFSGGIAGTGGITIAGGTETLTGSNGYTGATAIASGATLALAGTGSIASSRTVDAEGTFDVSQENGSVSIASLSGAGAVALGVNTLVLSNAANTFSGAIEGAGGITVAGGTQTLTGGNSYTGTTTIASGATLALAGAGSIASSSTADVEGRLDISQANGGASVTSLSGAGAVMLGANTLVFTNAADTFSGVISGAGNLTVSGGAETLSGANTYTGTTTVAGGMLIMGANAVLAPGSSLIVGNAGTLDLGSYNQTVTNAALSGVVNGTGSATLTAQTYSLTGATINANLGTGTLNVGAGASMLNGTAQTSVLNIDAGSLALGAQNLLPANIAVALSNAGTLNIGAYDQTIGSLAGQGSVQINSATLNVAQATDSSFAGSIAGNGTFSKSGAGTLVLTGDNSFAGTTNIVGGTLEVDGSLASSAVSVGSNAALAGTGSVGSLIVGQGAMLVPGVGGSIGTLAVAGNLLFQSGSTFQVNVTPTAASAVNVNGAITIQGGVVSVMANGTAYKVGTATYPVLTATGGVSGTFSTVKSNLVFLVPTLSYTANAVDLTLTRNNVDFASVAQTPNQRAVANTLNLMATDATLVQDVQSLSAPQARQAYDALSGQTYAALPSALIEESSRVRDTLLADGRRSGDGFGVFGDAMDDGGEFNATSDTAKLATHRQGIIAGIDYGHGGFRAGVASGYSYGTYLMGGLGSQSQVKSYYAGGQLSYQAGPIRAQIGGAYSWHDINTSRSADFADFTETLQSKQKAHTLQGFGELGYALIQRAGFKLEPFVGYAHIHAFVGGTNEMGSNGSLAALDVVAVKRDVNDATAGFHLTGSTPIGTGKALFQPHLTLAWQHAWGDRAGTATVALPGTAPFDIIGATLVGDSVKIDGGFDVAFGRITLGASYVGAAGTNQADHGVKANATMRF